VQARSTADISLQTLHAVRAELGADFQLEVDESQIFLRSAEPPSWVTFLAEADWWVKAMAAYAALYIAEIVKEAGKDTWKHRAKALSAAVAAANLVRRFGTALANLRKRLPSRTRIEIALPIPDDYFCTRVELTGTDADDLAVQIALFVHHLPALVELMRDEELDRRNVAGGILLTLLPDASLHVRWQDNDALREHTRTVPFKSEG
jgi:hypothetical protein